MRELSLASLVSGCFLLMGCASNQAMEPSSPQQTSIEAAAEKQVFVPIPDDGGVWHPASKGHCPLQLAGFDFAKTSVFKEDGKDVACQYQNASNDAAMTVYFYQNVAAKDATEAAQLAGQAIQTVHPQAEYLKAPSKDCTNHIDLMAGLSKAMVSAEKGTDSEILLGITPCYIFDLHPGKTLVATDMIGPWHLKIRLTDMQEDASNKRVKDEVTHVMIYERAQMTGEPVVNLQELLNPES